MHLHIYAHAYPAPKFDAELAEAYNKMANNHAHPKGPWPLMTAVVKKSVEGKTNIKILDIASGNRHQFTC